MLVASNVIFSYIKHFFLLNFLNWLVFAKRQIMCIFAVVINVTICRKLLAIYEYSIAFIILSTGAVIFSIIGKIVFSTRAEVFVIIWILTLPAHWASISNTSIRFLFRFFPLIGWRIFIVDRAICGCIGKRYIPSTTVTVIHLGNRKRDSCSSSKQFRCTIHFIMSLRSKYIIGSIVFLFSRAACTAHLFRSHFL